ncbi:LamB/YcsF family protein [Microvirga pudoricolor]|uniref:LamB/YcsF family protein n=1 Tax=Microvirga pudoricolor TaxID=2778729 RepID=UPI0019528B83|nr:5-oxoprolinase subunit PxpA [Microvirga pudoricolor]MBM6595166.1 LamB/YcsF family protein [Microvirga pudoricolor]
MRVDLNSDLGEGFGAWRMGDDAAMLDIVTTANVACGFHAGDPTIMRGMALEAKRKGVSVGAHPGFNDLWGFGRRVIRGDSLSDIEAMVAYQIGALQALAAMAGHRVTHVKTHGALNNLSMDDEDLATAVGRAIRAVDLGLVYLVMPQTAMERAALALDMPHALEVFADRAYDDAMRLVSRSQPGSVIHDADVVAERVLRMVCDGEIVSTSGKRMKTRVDSVCVHGDTPGAVNLARTVRFRLEAEGVEVAPFAA